MSSLFVLKELDKKSKPFLELKNHKSFQNKWISSIREAIGMSSTQLAKRLGCSRFLIRRYEECEFNGSIKLSTLEKVANGMDCNLYYCILPRSNTFTDLVKARALLIAKQAVMKSLQNMSLEDQAAISEIEDQVELIMDQLMHQNLKKLWDYDV